jgi:hypothetical protein
LASGICWCCAILPHLRWWAVEKTFALLYCRASMDRADEYRKRAAELIAQATLAKNPALALELTELGRVYMRLADQAERNSATDLVYEPPHPKLG